MFYNCHDLATHRRVILQRRSCDIFFHVGVSEQGGDLFALTRTGHVLDSSPKRHPDSSYATEYQSTIEEAAQTELARARACVRKINLFGVIKAVERVYDRRKALSLTQQESKAVVQQVLIFLAS